MGQNVHEAELNRLFVLSDELIATVRGLLGKQTLDDDEAEALKTANAELAAVTEELIELLKKRTKATIKS